MKYLIAILFSCPFLSCVSPFDFVIKDNKKTLAVEGGLFEIDRPYVTLNFTSQFGNTTNPEIIKNASVSVSDSNHNSYVFYYDLTAQKYFPIDEKFRGKPGNSYQLKIVLEDGQTFLSEPETLLASESFNEVRDNFLKAESVFEVSGQLPPKGSSPSIYLFNFITYGKAIICASCREDQSYERYEPGCGSVLKDCIEIAGKTPSRSLYGFGCISSVGCWNYKKMREHVIFNDEVLTENSPRKLKLFQVPLSSYARYFLEIHQSRISKKAYEYYQLIEEAGLGSGTLFDPTPALLVGNVFRENNENDKALGYFLIAGQKVYGHYVERSEQDAPLIKQDIEKEIGSSPLSAFTPLKGCPLPPISRCIPNNSFITDMAPEGWINY